eukprot:1140133-Pelagomonas_calceolata.AAC.1
MIIKALSKSPWGAGLVNIGIGSGDRLAQHKLNASNRIITYEVEPYLFPRKFPKRSRLTFTSRSQVMEPGASNNPPDPH